MTAERPHEGSVAPLGPQIGVDGPDTALDGGLGADAHEVGGDACGGAHGFLLIGPVDGFPDKNDIDVGDVVQLVAAALAHGDHGEPADRGVLGRGGPGDGEGGAEGGGGEVGEFGGGLGDVGGAAHIAGGDGQQAAPVGDAQRDGVGGLGEPRSNSSTPG